MKKLIAILMIVMMLMTGCAKKQDTKVVTKGQRFAVSAQWNKQNIECDIEWNADSIIFTIKQPEQLDGMQLEISNGQCTINYLGLKYTSDNQQILGSFAVLVYDVLQKSDGAIVQNCTLNNNSNGYEWTMLTDEKGSPKELIIDGLDATIKFNKK